MRGCFPQSKISLHHQGQPLVMEAATTDRFWKLIRKRKSCFLQRKLPSSVLVPSPQTRKSRVRSTKDLS